MSGSSDDAMPVELVERYVEIALLFPPSERELWVRGSVSDTKNDSYSTLELC